MVVVEVVVEVGVVVGVVVEVVVGVALEVVVGVGVALEVVVDLIFWRDHEKNCSRSVWRRIGKITRRTSNLVLP